MVMTVFYGSTYTFGILSKGAPTWIVHDVTTKGGDVARVRCESSAVSSIRRPVSMVIFTYQPKLAGKPCIDKVIPIINFVTVISNLIAMM